MRLGAGLAPERDVEQLSATEFRATSEEPWLRIETSGPPPAGRWVRLRYRTNLLADPVRPLLRVDRGDGEPVFLVLPGPVCGAAVWVGRIPDGATGLAISPVHHAGPFACTLDGMWVLSRFHLLAGAFRRRPGLTLKSLVLRLRGLKVRARHFLGAIWASTPFASYEAWLGEREAARLPEPAALVARTAEIAFRVVIAGGGDTAGFERMRASLAAQEHSPWTADAASDAPWIAWLQAGDILAPHALACMAAAILREPDLTVIYADEDRAGEGGGRSAPVLRPGWSPRLQARGGYIGGLLVTRRDAVGAAVPVDSNAPIAAALASPDVKVGHVRRILVHREEGSFFPFSQSPRSAGRRERDAGPLHHASHGPPPPQAGEDPAARLVPPPLAGEGDRPEGGGGGALPRHDEGESMARARPLVSIVIPNRDSPALIRACLDGLLDRTAYPHLEIVLVDNGSTDPATLASYGALGSDARVTRLDRPGPFNFSALTNAGVAASRGEIVLLLNNDIEVIEPDWLDRMVAELAAPDVGAVGAKLLYPDGRLQHGGVAIGLGGGAGHLYRGCPGATEGWLDRLAGPHEVSAVTGACLAVRRERYDAVGGLDETVFPVSYNDIDLCLKLRQRGWRNIMATSAILLHHESASRGRDVGPKAARAAEEARHFEAKWRSVMRDDPYFHPGLSQQFFDLHLG